MKLIHPASLVLACALLATAPSQARAGSITFGVDIDSATVTQVAGGFGGDDAGYLLQNSCLVLCSQSSYQFTIDTSALGDSSIDYAELTFDTAGLTTGGLTPEVFTVSVQNEGGFQQVGTLGYGSLSLNLSQFGDEISDGLLTILVQTSPSILFPESVRLDGANLQVSSVPEPATISLLGVGLFVSAGLTRVRNRRAAAG